MSDTNNKRFDVKTLAKEDATPLEKSTSSRNRVRSRIERAKIFADLVARIDIAGIRELSKVNPEAAYMAAQQVEQDLLTEQKQHQQSQMAAQEELGSVGPESDMTEAERDQAKELALQAQLPFQKSNQLQSIQQLKMDIENELRARSMPSPTMTH